MKSFVKHRRVYREVVDPPALQEKLKAEGKAMTAGRIAGRALRRFRDRE